MASKHEAELQRLSRKPGAVTQKRNGEVVVSKEVDEVLTKIGQTEWKKHLARKKAGKAGPSVELSDLDPRKISARK